MRVLVTGGRGQLGSELAFVAGEFARLEFVFADRAELDVCDERAVFAAVCGGDLRAGTGNGADVGAEVVRNSNLDEKRGKNGGENCNFNAQNGATLTSNSNLDAKVGKNGGENGGDKTTAQVATGATTGKTTAQNFADKIPPTNKTAPRPFDTVINCAAYTAVDRAESDEPAAFALNAAAADNLARACSAAGARLVHISTDYVFDGTAHRPLSEADPVAPLGVYGRSKLAGERAVLEAHLAHSCIVRTSWLYSEFGGNFVKTIARAARQRERLAVVADQIGTPTNARDLARAICAILPQLDGVAGTEILHYSGEGAASWFDFACEIVRLVGREAACEVAAISSAEFLAQNAGRAIAPRPFYSVLDKGKIKARFGLKIPHWLASLRGANIAAWA